MAFETGSATDFEDLISRLMTFATANGWTQDEFETDDGDFALHKGNIFVSGRWDTTAPNNISLHQATAFDGVSTLPGDHTGDSGNGFNTTTSHTDGSLDNERCINNIGDGPYPSYFFFENDAGPAYLNVVLEFATDRFAHFGFGEIIKVGDWTGGEYVYGHYHEAAGAVVTINCCSLDGLFDDAQVTDLRRAPTMRAIGLPGQAGPDVWAQIYGGTDAAPPDDSAGEPKINVHGGFRGGPVARGLFLVGPAGTTSGLIPMVPLTLMYRRNSNEFVYFLGYMEDVRQTNIKFFAPKEAVVIGSDTWYFFPQRQKTIIGGPTDRTDHSCLAYKRVDA